MAVSTRATPAGPAVPVSSPRWRLILTVALLVLAIAGTAISAYLAYENSQGKSGVCTIAHGCSTVQQSKYGKILGIPISMPGLGLYMVLAASAAIVLSNYRGWRPYATLAGFYGSFFGFAFSVYLTYLEAFVIDAWCIYCITSALFLTALTAGWGVNLASEVRERRR